MSGARALFTVLMLLLATAAGPAVAADRALLVGINAYPNLPESAQLNHSRADAQKVERFLLESHGFAREHVKSVFDAAATREGILRSFREWLIEGTAPGDRVLFYYSGHGLRVTSGGRVMSALAPHDTRRPASQREEFGNILYSDELTSLRRELAGRHVVFVVDACHSGKIARGSGDAEVNDGVRAKSLTIDSVAYAQSGPVEVTRPPRDPAPARAGSFALWAAAAPNQIAFEDSRAGGSVFTNALVAGLSERRADANRNGKIEVAELLQHVTVASKQFCDGTPKCKDGLVPDLTADPDDDYRMSVFAPWQNASDPPPNNAPVETAFSHTNDFPLRLAMQPSTNVTFGSSIRFQISSAEAGRLMIFDQSPDGFTQVFPNKHALGRGSPRSVPANAMVAVPRAEQAGWSLQAGTRGRSKAIVLVVQDRDGAVDEIGRRFDELQRITDATRFLGAIAGILQKPVVDPRPNVPDRAVRWSYSVIDYEVR
jgi:metacaspase-1